MKAFMELCDLGHINLMGFGAMAEMIMSAI